MKLWPCVHIVGVVAPARTFSLGWVSPCSVAAFALALCQWLVLLSADDAMGQSDSLSRWYWRNPLPAGNTLNAVAYGNGTFIAVGDGAMVLVSTDGTHWAMRDFGIQCQLSGVAYGGGLFVVMGNSDGIPVVGTSTDGIDWESATLDTPLLPEAVVYGNGRFVAVASRASNAGSADTNLTGRAALDPTASPSESLNI